jgi:hypothetical protein
VIHVAVANFNVDARCRPFQSRLKGLGYGVYGLGFGV